MQGCLGPPGPVPLPLDAVLDPRRLHAAVLDRYGQRRSVRGEARIDLFNEDGYLPFSLMAAAQRPGRLHLEALSPFDAPVAILSCDGERFQLYSLKEMTFYHGPATQRNISRLLPLHLAPGDLVELLLGGAPLLPEPPRVGWDGEQGHYLLRLRGPDGREQRLELDPGDLAVLSSRVETREGELVYQLHLSDHAMHGQLRLPGTVRFEMPSDEVDLTLRWREREMNVSIPAEAWSQQPPVGARMEHLH